MMTTATKFRGSNYSIELVDGVFVLDTPATDTERFDSFDNLVEAHPVCDESRGFFFGFRFATDSETGVIEADSYDAACEKLDAMVGDTLVAPQIVQINEYDQNIFYGNIAEVSTLTPFLRELVAEAIAKGGSAERADDEGCPVTVTIR